MALCLETEQLETVQRILSLHFEGLEVWAYGPRLTGVDLAGKNRVGDNYEETSKNFKIKLNEWKVVAVIKWDNSLESPKSNPLYPGSAIVTDVAMPDEGIEIDPVNHPICSFDSADAILVPIWDAATYRQYVETITNDGRKIGICHEPQV